MLEHILYYMPTILDAFQVEDAYWYHQAITFQFEFMLHIVMDVVVEINKLNHKFHYNLIDISTIGFTLDYQSLF